MAKSSKKRQGKRPQGTRSNRPARTPRASRRSATMVFSRQNYLLLLLGVAVVVVGYLIMSIDNQVEGVLSLYVAPLLILGGYLEIIYAILWRPKDNADAETQTSS